MTTRPAAPSTGGGSTAAGSSRLPARRSRLAEATAQLGQAGRVAREAARDVARNRQLTTPMPTRPDTPDRRHGRVVSIAHVRQLAHRARSRRLGRKAAVASVVAAVLALLVGYLVLFSPLLALRHVAVVGGERFSVTELQVIAAADIGRPLARVDTTALAAAVQAVPSVKHAQVVRVWPNSLEVRVTERVPVAAVPRAEGIFDLMAADGVVVDSVDAAPVGLPTVTDQTVVGGADALQAAATVLDSLPPAVRATVTTASATTRDNVQLTMQVLVPPDPQTAHNGGDKTGGDKTGGDAAGAKPTAQAPVEPKTATVTVVWGSPEESALKAEVLAVLLKTPAAVYDVSSPQTPVTR